MYKRILFALDLEGVNNVVGEAYKGLAKGSEEWETARGQAVLEINAAAEALFDAGAERVSLWDNHAGGGNVDPERLDNRIELLDVCPHDPRMDFASDEYDCICYFGYHAMEGTLGGVLAHTMSSVAIQYYKLNGMYIGEVDMDAYLAASHGMPSRLFVGGDIACKQARRAVPDIVTVVTKTEISRNEALFRNNEELFADIKKGVLEAVKNSGEVRQMSFPATMEKSFKRTEDAAIYLRRLLASGILADYLSDDVLGKDAHTVVSTINNIDDFKKAI